MHALIETASCQACVDVCPKKAWILDDDSLGLDTSLCDGCGLCVPACSEGAITQTKDCTIREDDQEKALLLACEYISSNNDTKVRTEAKTETETDDNHWKCIHAVSENELLNLHNDGIYQIIVSKGDCENCSRGSSKHLNQRIADLNKMFLYSDLKPLRYNELPAERWHQLRETPEQFAPGPDMTRRMFFLSAVQRSVDTVFHYSSFDSTHREFVPLAKKVEGIQGENALFPAVPTINPEKCNGCDACLRVCPHGALLFKLEASKARYEIDASTCSACYICIDICDQDAISLSKWVVQAKENRMIHLNMETCESCGAVFHYPKIEMDSKALSQNLCNICRKVNHQKNLFQVFE